MFTANCSLECAALSISGLSSTRTTSTGAEAKTGDAHHNAANKYVAIPFKLPFMLLHLTVVVIPRALEA